MGTGECQLMKSTLPCRAFDSTSPIPLIGCTAAQLTPGDVLSLLRRRPLLESVLACCAAALQAYHGQPRSVRSPFAPVKPCTRFGANLSCGSWRLSRWVAVMSDPYGSRPSSTTLLQVLTSSDEIWEQERAPLLSRKTSRYLECMR